MTNEQMRVVIAEELGWKFNPDSESWSHPDQEMRRRLNCISGCLPDYPNDLNACHEMEKVFNNSLDGDKYGHALCDITLGLNRGENVTLNYWALMRVAKATAHQRCVAGIKTKCPKKWKD